MASLSAYISVSAVGQLNKWVMIDEAKFPFKLADIDHGSRSSLTLIKIYSPTMSR